MSIYIVRDVALHTNPFKIGFQFNESYDDLCVFMMKTMSKPVIYYYQTFLTTKIQDEHEIILSRLGDEFRPFTIEHDGEMGKSAIISSTFPFDKLFDAVIGDEDYENESDGKSESETESDDDIPLEMLRKIK